MTKTELYRAQIRSESDLDAYLMVNSGLPGPRSNLELLQAAVEECSELDFRRWMAFGPDIAPVNSQQEFLAACGTVGLGRLLTAGQTTALEELRQHAADPRWRVREAVAMALQRWGDTDLPALLAAMVAWSRGTRWEQRAVVAGLCEPRLLRESSAARQVLGLLDEITEDLSQAVARKDESFRVLRQALGYGWSVAVAALPTAGQPMMERWFGSTDRDVRWIMRENLRKNRLERVDPAWVAGWQARL